MGLSSFRLLGCEAAETHIEPNTKIQPAEAGDVVDK